MRVLILGGTGSIGSAVVTELARNGHDVFGLARSETSAVRLKSLNATPIAGDTASPQRWLKTLPEIDAVIHAAAAFDDDDEVTERRLLQHLLPFLQTAGRMIRFIYSGGCWLYPATDGSVTTEATPFAPLPAFAWAVVHSRVVLSTAGIHPIVLHPAMVYEATGGVFSRFHSDAIARDAIRVVSSESVRWPLVHREDLATLYRLALEGSPPGEEYLGAAIEGLPVGRIARAYARRFQTLHQDPEIISEAEIAAELGEWARGYALDQLQSGAKARRVLGWAPKHLDPEAEIISIP